MTAIWKRSSTSVEKFARETANEIHRDFSPCAAFISSEAQAGRQTDQYTELIQRIAKGDDP